MKKHLAWLVVLMMVADVAKSQPLFTYGKKSVSKEEFLKAFNKNPDNGADRKKALREYLDLYLNFKLKVQAAYDSNLHQDPNYLYETSNFKKQLAENFINGEAKITTLVNEAFERSQKDIHLTQVFIEAKSGEEAAAFTKANKAYNDLKSGKAFEKVIAEYSSDVNGSDLGWITVFSLPYQFENTVYNLKQGEFSEAVKSAYGYHIFRNEEQRPALGRRKVAQILIAVPQNPTASEKAEARRKADSVYQLLLEKKIKWEDAVRNFSNDMTTAYRNGELQEFGVGEYSPAFENAAFALKAKGDISKPVETSYGFHILQLNEIIPVAKDMNDAVAAAALKERVEKDDRLAYAKKNLVNKWMKTIGYKPATFDNTELWLYVDSFTNNKSTAGFKKIKDSTVLFSFAKQKIKANDFARFYRAAKHSGNYKGLTDDELLKEYISITAGEYYKDHLEDYNPQLAEQSKEFNEANLLFAIMDKMVWSRAGADEEGLRKYYDEHKSKYIWETSADALIVTTADEKLVDELQQKIANAPGSWRTIVESYGSSVVADSSRYELSQIPVLKGNHFEPAMATAPVKNNDGSTTFAYIVKVYKDKEQRNFEDARGFVINDYQAVLEERWLRELKKKYPVKVNESVFAGIK